MKRISIIILLLLPLLVVGQNKTKFTYREAPKTGEWILLAGLGLVAITATGLMHNERINPDLSKAIGMVGGGLIYAGVVIDLNSKGRRVKYKYKRNRRRVRVRF